MPAHSVRDAVAAEAAARPLELVVHRQASELIADSAVLRMHLPAGRIRAAGMPQTDRMDVPMPVWIALGWRVTICTMQIKTCRIIRA